MKHFSLTPEQAAAEQDWARSLVSTWPPLTETQKARLRVLMLGGRDEADTA
jgi:hypothetical protein